jgi:hypothetical protein
MANITDNQIPDMAKVVKGIPVILTEVTGKSIDTCRSTLKGRRRNAVVLEALDRLNRFIAEEKSYFKQKSQMEVEIIRTTKRGGSNPTSPVTVSK